MRFGFNPLQPEYCHEGIRCGNAPVIVCGGFVLFPFHVAQFAERSECKVKNARAPRCSGERRLTPNWLLRVCVQTLMVLDGRALYAWRFPCLFEPRFWAEDEVEVEDVVVAMMVE